MLHTVIQASDLRDDFKLNEFVQRVNAEPFKWIKNRRTYGDVGRGGTKVKGTFPRYARGRLVW